VTIWGYTYPHIKHDAERYNYRGITFLFHPVFH